MSNNTSVERDYFFDNIKGLLIFFVVFGHLITLMPSDKGIRDLLYSTIYIFHMPMFVLTSGYFFKKQGIKSIINLSFLYLLWQLIIFPIGYSLLTGISLSKSITGFIIPKWTYWYLVSLISWKFIVPFLPKNKWVFILLIGTSLIPATIESIDWRLLSIGRTISFLPFFYLGYILDNKHIEKLKKITSKKLSIILGLITICIAYYLFINLNISKEILHLKKTYVDLVGSDSLGIKLRLLTYILSITSMVTIIPLINNEKNILTKWGTNTLNIYLTHAIILASFKKYATLKMNIHFSFSFVIIALIFTYGFCELLSSEYVKNKMKLITNIKLFK